MSELDQQNIKFGEVIATILDGQTVSDAVFTKSNVVTGIIAPSTFSGITLTFQVSVDKTNFFPLFNADGSLYTLTVAASQAVISIPQQLAGWNAFKLVSNTTQSGSDAEIIVVARPI